jgi:hypothetical protein
MADRGHSQGWRTAWESGYRIAFCWSTNHFVACGCRNWTRFRPLQLPVLKSPMRTLPISRRTNQDLTSGIRISFAALKMKTFWQRFVDRQRRIVAEVTSIQLEMARRKELKSPPPVFPQKPYKASAIALFCVFGFFIALAAWACLKDLVTPFFR